jgi:hypothetical protein
MTKDQARQLVEKYVEGVAQDADVQFGIDDEQTMETSFGWVFFYNTVEYLATKDPLTMAVGNAPLIVDEESGRLQEMGTAHPIEHYIAEFEHAKSRT